MRSTGFAANEFDFIISAYTVFHYGDPLQPDMQKDSLTELSRILKPGGKLLIIGLTQGMELVSERSGSFNLKLVEPRGRTINKYNPHSEFLLEKF